MCTADNVRSIHQARCVKWERAVPFASVILMWTKHFIYSSVYLSIYDVFRMYSIHMHIIFIVYILMIRAAICSSLATPTEPHQQCSALNAFQIHLGTSSCLTMAIFRSKCCYFNIIWLAIWIASAIFSLSPFDRFHNAKQKRPRLFDSWPVSTEQPVVFLNIMCEIMVFVSKGPHVWLAGHTI